MAANRQEAETKKRKPEIQVIAENRRARHEYHLGETFEAGIALTGTEVKSLRLGKVNLRDSYAGVENGRVLLYNMHISPYEKANRFNHEPLRPRQLLLHRHEIRRLASQVREKGLTLVPTRLYFRRGLAKVEIAIAKGKHFYDKRSAMAERDAQRDIQRALRGKDET